MEKLKTIAELFWIFFKIGLFTFGGGYAMIPFMEEEIVEKRHWLTEEEIADYFAVGNSLPGIIAINAGTFIGQRIGGFFGAVAATVGVSLPAFLAILLVVTILNGIENNIYVQKFFLGIRAASTALVLLVVIKFVKKFVHDWLDWLLFITGFLIIAVLHYSAIWVIIGAGAIGLIFMRGRAEK